MIFPKVVLDPDLVRRLEDMSEDEQRKVREHFPETTELEEMPLTLREAIDQNY